MADLQETQIPVTNTGANPPENPFASNPLGTQTNPFAEQPTTLEQPQEVAPAQTIQEPIPTPTASPDFSAIQQDAPSEPNGALLNSTPINTTETVTQEASNLTDSQSMVNAAKKERLAQLLKAEQEKGKKAGFTKGLLSGIAITACALVVCVVFAKEQVLNLLGDGNTTPTNLEASVVDLASEATSTEDATLPAEDETLPAEDETLPAEDETLPAEDVTLPAEDVTLPAEDETLPTEDETLPAEDATLPAEDVTLPAEDETLPAEDKTLPAEDETLPAEDETLPAEDETLPTEDETLPTEDETLPAEDETLPAEDETLPAEDETSIHDGYTIKHVTSESEANWVLPAHCSDLTCYGEDKDFTTCTSFRLAENLDENAHRIGNNGICRYKDTSELVFVEFNN